MIDADDKTIPQNVDISDDDGGFGDIIKTGIKAIAVTLSVVFLLLSILTVAVPLSAMRTFNKLGWSERALVSGDRYITRRLEKNDINPDDAGIGSATYYAEHAALNDINDEDMREAYDVCMSLSRNLLGSTAARGDMESAKYFADKLEKYTRQYMSLGGIISINREKSEYNVDSMPDIRMRPYVYDYAHTVMLDNFRARAYTGDTDRMLYDSGRSGDCLTTTRTLANSYSGASIPEESPAAAAAIDAFVDYVDQLGVYLSVKFAQLGVPAAISESTFLPDPETGEPSPYSKILSGADFDLFITQSSGYTEIYNGLKSAFGKYAQAAADFNAVTIDDELHKLYWLQALGSASTKLWYMSMLLYYDRTASYGMSRAAIEQEYRDQTCEKYKLVEFDLGDGFGRKPTVIEDVYGKLMKNYLLHFAAAA